MSNARQIACLFVLFLASVSSVGNQLLVQRIILGSDKSGVDEMLKSWSCREDKQSTKRITIYRYTKDVTLIVHFENGNSVGVAAIDNPGNGVVGISEKRFRELVEIIGREPEPVNIISDEHGIREFSVGKTDYDDD